MPEKLPLSDELVALICHVELNETGWWDKGVRWLIAATLWQSDKTISDEGSLRHEVRRLSGIDLQAGQLAPNLKELIEEGTIVRLPNGSVKISESSRMQFEEDVAKIKDEERYMEEKFIGRLQNTGFSRNRTAEIWRSFVVEFFTPMIRELGVGTYSLITNSGVSVDASKNFTEFLAKFPPEKANDIRNAIIATFDPQDAVCRGYILRHLHAYLLIEATNLNSRTLRELLNATKTRPEFHIYLDTNFLFSILGLHDNPSNEAAVALMELIESIKSYVTVEVLAYPLTIDEAQYVLNSARTNLKELAITPNLAEAALQSDVSGITRAYVSKKATFGNNLTPATYFDPYIGGLRTILKTHNVNVPDESTSSLEKDPIVEREVIKQHEFFRSRGRRDKSEEQVRHDVVLWEYVHRKRGSRTDSPIDARYWIATVDYSFLAYDEYRRQNNGRLRTCIHPANLIQLLQFWVPRTTEYEEAAASTFRLPFLSHVFDREDERVTLAILKQLARYTEVRDIPVSVAAELLMSKALRQRIQNDKDIEKQVHYVQEELTVQLQKQEEEIQKYRERSTQQETQIQLQIQVAADKDRKIEELEQTLRIVEQDQKDIHTQLDKEHTNKLRRNFLLRWSGYFLLLLAFIAIFLWALQPIIMTYAPARLTNLVQLVTAFSISLCLLVLYRWRILAVGDSQPAIREWQWFQRLRNFIGAVAIVGSLVYSVFLSMVSDYLWEIVNATFKLTGN